MYGEILEIANFCKMNKIPCKLTELYDGYKIIFGNHADIVQHRYSYNNECCVEPAGFNETVDYTPQTVEEMKKILEKHLTTLQKYDIINM